LICSTSASRLYYISVIGLGPRGLCVLDELMRSARRLSTRGISLHLFLIEPREFGPGVHDISLANHFRLNTTAGLLTALSPTLTKGTKDPHRLTFLEWLHLSGPCDCMEYSTRSSFGQYLSYCYGYLLTKRPPNVAIAAIPHSATDIHHSVSGNLIDLDDGSQLSCDFVFLTCGRSQLREIEGRTVTRRIGVSALYRQPSCGIPSEPGLKVAINGMGLTAYDALAALTTGRGGSFADDSSLPKMYLPGNKECIIYLFSRSGIPSRSRCSEAKDCKHVPIILTRTRIHRLRGEHGLLNFAEHIEPLLYAEIRLAYYLAHVAIQMGEWARQKAIEHFKRLLDSGRTDGWFRTMQTRYGAFDEKEALWPSMDKAQAGGYASRWLSLLSDDLKETRAGYSRSPLKAAIEVLLELRPEIKFAVDNECLTEASKRDFYQRFVAIINRNVIGPQMERNEELLSLVRSGIVSLAAGPSPIIEPERNGMRFSIRPASLPSVQISVDYLIDAFVEDSKELFERSVLLKNLSCSGVASFNTSERDGVSGLKTDRANGVVNAFGVRIPTIWALGSVCEGTTYYNNYVPTVIDDGSAPAFSETSAAVMEMFELIGSRQDGAE